MPTRLLLLILLIFLCAAPSAANLQDCTPPPITIDSSVYNIFTPEQEMILGELTYQRMSGDLQFVRDPELVAYVREIGEKLIKHLPQTGIKFQFFIVDLPDANAFNIPGGYVFVSRKLIALANNEDELAGVIAHELGHATVRHGARDMSQLLKKVLNVKQLGDRKDVAEKYNLILERIRTKSISRDRNHEDDKQLQADQIGLYALVAAGYPAESFADFFSRLVETKAKGGNWFTDIFGSLNPEEKRLREMSKATEKMPAQCKETRHPQPTETFLRWQANVVSYRDLNRKEQLTGLLWKKELAPKLRSDISHFAFSQDGEHFLAQDDFAITVFQREPLKVVFQIPAPDSHGAAFSPDGKFVVFGSKNLRYEKWSLAEKKPVEMRELVVARDCMEHDFSPDGKYLVCVDYGLGLNVLDTQTGKKIWEKKKVFELDFLEYWSWIQRDPEDEGQEFFHIEFSPDSHFLAVARSSHFRFHILFDMYAAGTDDKILALDLNSLKEVSVGGDLKKMAQRPFIFLDSNRVLATARRKEDSSGIYSFPEGKRLEKMFITGEALERTANSNYVIVKPMANAKLGVFDLTKKTIVNGLDKNDAAIWGDVIIYESINGKVLLKEARYDEELKRFQGKDLGTIEVPVGSLGTPQTAEISDNLQFLAVSSKTRGAIWDLATGERKMYVRAFHGAMLANTGDGIGDFPKYDAANHSLVVMTPATNGASLMSEIPEKGARQYRRFLLSRRSLKEPEKKPAPEKEKTGKLPGAEEAAAERSLSHEVRFDLFDLITNKSVWTEEFAKGAPGYFFDEYSGRLILYSTLGTDWAKAALKENAALVERAREMGNKDDDYLVKIVDGFAGKVVGSLLLETGKGSFDIEYGFSEGDWLVLHDNVNRVIAYSIKAGDLRHRFFGSKAAINALNNQIVVENYPGELTFYDLSTGDSQAQLSFPSSAAFMRYSLDGRKLFVLSGEQTAYVFDVDKLQAKPVAAVP